MRKINVYTKADTFVKTINGADIWPTMISRYNMRFIRSSFPFLKLLLMPLLHYNAILVDLL